MRRLAVVALAAALAAASPSTAAQRRPDPMREKQWGLDAIDAGRAHSRSTGRGVVIAIVDTGVDLAHPDLKAKLVPGYDATAPSSPPVDHHGHGTMVAGIAAASTLNGIGIAGVAPDARIMPIKVLRPDGRGSLTDLAEGIVWAADHGADVINLSLGLSTGIAPPDLPASSPVDPLDPIREAIAHAWQRGAVVIASAGNTSVPTCTSPATEKYAVCVGAVDRRNLRSYYSQGDATEQHDEYLVAPGGSSFGLYEGQEYAVGGDEDILSTVARGSDGDYGPDPGYAYGAGTSMSAPFVSGVAALLVAQGLTNQQVVDRLKATATDLGVPGRDGVYGYGLVNAARAVGAR